MSRHSLGEMLAILELYHECEFTLMAPDGAVFSLADFRGAYKAIMDVRAEIHASVLGDLNPRWQDGTSIGALVTYSTVQATPLDALIEMAASGVWNVIDAPVKDKTWDIIYHANERD